MVGYDRFVARFDRALGTDSVARALAKQPTAAFISAGVHRPSVLTEDAGSPRNYLEASSYFTMGERADDVGTRGLGGRSAHRRRGGGASRAHLARMA